MVHQVELHIYWSPHSSIIHVCETLSVQTYNPGDAPLGDKGLGNVEFNNRY